MRTLMEFTKTTFLVGFLIILPVYISILLLAKAVGGVLTLLNPITDQIPATVEFRQVLAALALIASASLRG